MEKEKTRGSDFNEKVCPVCGKKFLVLSKDWVYKLYYRKNSTTRYKYVCSYSCMMKGREKKK